MWPRIARSLLVPLLTAAASCTLPWSKKPAAAVPSAPRPAATPAPAPPKQPAETTLPPPPTLAEAKPPAPPDIPPEKIETPPGPKRRPRPKKNLGQTASQGTAPALNPQPAAPPAATQPAAPAGPKLGQIFTAEQRQEYLREVDEALERVRRALQQIQNRVLNDAQAEMAGRIRSFEKQALAARDQDPVGAVSLAKRADVLARDLLAQFP